MVSSPEEWKALFDNNLNAHKKKDKLDKFYGADKTYAFDGPAFNATPRL